MKNTNTILSHIISPILLCGGVLLTASSLSSCCHKDLVYPATNRGHLNVVFDWRNAPEADPASMVLYLYDNKGTNPIRYLFQNSFGGRIRVPSGLYNGMCLNGDLTDWAVMSEGETIDGYTISTADAPALAVTGIATANLPSSRADDEDTEGGNERMAATPGMLWGSRLDNIVTPHNDEEKTVTLYPDEKVCHYVVDIYDCGDVADYPAAGIDATLSGMAEGYRVGRDTPHENKVTHPIVLTPDVADNSMHSEFLTFGTSPTSRKHTLSLYMVRSDGVKWNCNIDVSSQVNNAADPKHVHIIVRGVTLPEPAPSGTTVNANVDDWVSEYIDLAM